MSAPVGKAATSDESGRKKQPPKKRRRLTESQAGFARDENGPLAGGFAPGAEATGPSKQAASSTQPSQPPSKAVLVVKLPAAVPDPPPPSPRPSPPRVPALPSSLPADELEVAAARVEQVLESRAQQAISDRRQRLLTVQAELQAAAGKPYLVNKRKVLLEELARLRLQERKGHSSSDNVRFDKGKTATFRKTTLQRYRQAFQAAASEPAAATAPSVGKGGRVAHLDVPSLGHLMGAATQQQSIDAAQALCGVGLGAASASAAASMMGLGAGGASSSPSTSSSDGAGRGGGGNNDGSMAMVGGRRGGTRAAMKRQIVESMLIEHGLEDPHVYVGSGDVCDECGVQMVVIANDSLLTCPQCGIARMLSNTTAAAASSGNDLDYSSSNQSKQKSHVMYVMEYTQGLQAKEPSQSVVDAVSAFMWKTQRVGLEAFAAEIAAAEDAAGGAFADVDDAIRRLQPSIPNIQDLLLSISYAPVYEAMQKTYEALKRSSEQQALAAAAAAKEVADEEEGEEGDGRGGAIKKAVTFAPDTKQPTAATTASKPKPTKKTASAGKSGLAKEVNGSYELAAKVAAIQSGYHSIQMASQQREQIHMIWAVIQREYDRLGLMQRMPNRFPHLIRHVLLLRGYQEFCKLYPIPPIGSSILCMLEEKLQQVFNGLGLEWHPLQEKFVPTAQQLADGIVNQKGVAVVHTREGVTYWREVPSPQLRWESTGALIDFSASPAVANSG